MTVKGQRVPLTVPMMRLCQEAWIMRKATFPLVVIFCWLFLGMPCVCAQDVGWMQQGVRVWYFGGAGTTMSSDAEEALVL